MLYVLYLSIVILYMLYVLYIPIVYCIVYLGGYYFEFDICV